MSFTCLGKEVGCLCSASWLKLARLCRSFCFLFSRYYRSLLLLVNSFCIQVLYFVFLSLLGFWVLKALKPRTSSFSPRDLDLFFTAVSSATVSSMSTVEMEVFSNAQLVVMTVLMFVGGEVFTSLIGLHFRMSKLRWLIKTEEKVTSVDTNLCPSKPTNVIVDHIELGAVADSDSRKPQVEPQLYGPQDESIELDYLKCRSVKFLCFVVLGYLLGVHVLGVAAVSLYMTLVSSARDVLKKKGLKMMTFSVFTTVSTFTNCGFVPTNENMIVFSKNSGLLLILIPQVLLGNTLFPPALRLTLWLMGRFSRRAEIEGLLSSTGEVGYKHLLPSLHSSLLVVTVLGFIGVQFIMFCSMQRDSESLSGLSSYEKIVGVLFQCVNTRYAGETIVDLSKVAPAVLVLFVVMMYLPPYTTFFPARGGEGLPGNGERGKPKRSYEILLENLIFSQLSYLAIFIIMVCMAETKKMKEDPINFNVLNIVVEVISAYGNVGFTTGYSCERQLRRVEGCEDKWYGFSGKWSDEGKIILIIVMIFGRLKKSNVKGGRAWVLL
ncbi:sodium transporter HKT1-like isoform X1 [Rhodamnia argentea]|uniref:Sodium transporter HKT1-like isoform X1 n=1 Tax=Rhodamnia argentea TaxID=178133 RepID=A0A8B8NIS6_9MYRT|nr:sodium transporter HKT1-like isoform X1 [Rhodamnia argentea]